VNYVKRAREVLDLEAKGIAKVRNRVGPEFSRAVEIILKGLRDGGKIVVTGIGKNLPIAEKLSATLASTGSTSVVLNPAQAMHGDLGILCPGDVLLALSYSGESDEILNLLPVVRRLGVKVIALTGASDTTLTKYSDASLSVAVDREACPFNMAPTASTTATLAMGDALAMVLLDARGFKREDYAKLHPGGAIGRALLLRVCDIMRTGKQVASVRKSAKARDAILAMTKARSGSAAIVDSANRLLGIFTDGDLRRHVALHRNLMSLPITQVMTASPITVRATDLAADVLRVFEEHNIDDLLVVDEHNRLVGAVDIQDLPKLKIM
jgi:arabinose-5-phosphate isomerase